MKNKAAWLAIIIGGLSILLSLLTLLHGEEAKEPKPVTAVINCIPAQNLVLGATNDGQMVKGPEDWSAECSVFDSNNKKLFEGSYHYQFPQSKEEARSYGVIIADELAHGIARDMRKLRDDQ